MKAIEIAFTVLPVKELKSSRHFYEEVLNLKPTHIFEKDGMGMIEYDIGPGTLAIGSGAPLFKPSKDGGAVALEVDDFEKAMQSLREKAVNIVMDAFETPVCFMATIADPDGNYIIIHKRKPNHS
jgi:predicted enzyme related to lactoylglutathione lyase